MPRQKSAAQKAEEAKRKQENARVVRQKLKLLTMVRDYPILYDKGHPDHLNADMKLVVWENIATQLGETSKHPFQYKFMYLQSRLPS